MSASDLVAHQVKPGEVRNPLGHNQYTYRDDAKKAFAELAKSNADDFLEKVFDLAKDGESWAAKLVWEEILPAVKSVELLIPGADPLGLADGLAALAAKRRANGHDRGATTAATDSDSGVAS